MVRRIKSGFIATCRDFVHAFTLFNHNARAHLVSASLQAAGAGMVGTVFALYIKSAQLGESVVGYVEGAFSLGMAVIALVGPPLVAAFGYRALMLFGLGLLVVSRFAQAAMPMSTSLILLGLAIGVGDGFLRTVNAAYLSENSTHDVRAHLFSAEFLVRMVAVFVGGMIGGFLPGLIGGPEMMGFQWTVTAGAVIMGAGMVPMLFLHKDTPRVKQFFRVQLKTAREFDAWGHLGKLIMPQAFLAAAAGLTAPFVPLYLNHTLGASVKQIGLIQGFSALAIGVAAFATPIMARKLGRSVSVLILQLAALPMLFAVPAIGSLTFGVVVLLTRATLMNVGGPLWGQSSMEGVKAADKPFVAGGLLFVLSLTSFFGNVGGGRLMEVSYTAPYVPAALLWAVGTALTWLLWVRPEKVAATADEPVAIPVQAELVAEAA